MRAPLMRAPLMRAPLVCAIVLAVLGAALWARPAGALGPKDRRLTDARSGISVEAPAGWTLSQHTGYADTIVLLLHPDGSRITVSATSTSLRTAEELYQQNRAALTAQGLSPTPAGTGPRGSLAIDLGAPGKPDKLRQLYLVRETPLGRQAIVLTLVSPGKAFPSRLPALDLVTTRLSLDDPLPPSAANRSRSGAAGAGGATAP